MVNQVINTPSFTRSFLLSDFSTYDAGSLQLEKLPNSVDEDHETFRIIVKLNNSNDRIYSLFGNQNTHLNCPPSYQAPQPFGKDLGGVNPALFTFRTEGCTSTLVADGTTTASGDTVNCVLTPAVADNPATTGVDETAAGSCAEVDSAVATCAYEANDGALAEFDSWLTLGIVDGDPSNQLSTVGIDFAGWNESQHLFTDNGAVFYMDATSAVQGDITIAQFTLPKQRNNFDFTGGLQGEKANGNDFQVWFSITIPETLNITGDCRQTDNTPCGDSIINPYLCQAAAASSGVNCTFVEATDQDCEGIWSPCSENCEIAPQEIFTLTPSQRYFIEQKPQIGSGQSCNFFKENNPPSNCGANDGQCLGSVNCEGSWSACNSDCKKTYTITTERSGNGLNCAQVNGTEANCYPGQGDCPPDPIDCVGSWSDCDDQCQSTYTITQEAQHGGIECDIANNTIDPNPESCPNCTISPPTGNGPNGDGPNGGGPYGDTLDNCNNYEYAISNLKECCSEIDDFNSDLNKICSYAKNAFTEELIKINEANRKEISEQYRTLNEKIIRTYTDSVDDASGNIIDDNGGNDNGGNDNVVDDNGGNDNIVDDNVVDDSLTSGGSQEGCIDQDGCEVSNDICINDTLKKCDVPNKGYAILQKKQTTPGEEGGLEFVVPCHRIIKNIRELNEIEYSISDNIDNINIYCNEMIKGECTKYPNFCNDPKHLTTDCCMSSYMISIYSAIDFIKKNKLIFLIILIIISIPLLYFMLSSDEKKVKMKENIKKFSSMVPLR